MMGDSSKLLTHYHDDARTLYEVFQRGLHISGGCGVRSYLSHTHTHPRFLPHTCMQTAPTVNKWFHSSFSADKYVLRCCKL